MGWKQSPKSCQAETVPMSLMSFLELDLEDMPVFIIDVILAEKMNKKVAIAH